MFCKAAYFPNIKRFLFFLTHYFFCLLRSHIQRYFNIIYISLSSYPPFSLLFLPFLLNLFPSGFALSRRQRRFKFFFKFFFFFTTCFTFPLKILRGFLNPRFFVFVCVLSRHAPIGPWPCTSALWLPQLACLPTPSNFA